MVDDDYRKAKAMNTIKDNLQTNILEEDELFPGVYHAMEKFNFKEDGLIEVLIAAQESHGFLSNLRRGHIL
jgi:hypothetical protein